MTESTHWKSLQDNKYLGVADFKPNEEKVVKISRVVSEEIPPKNVKKDVIYFANYPKPLVANATNCKIISKLLKSAYIESWVGKEIILFADMTVRAPGQKSNEIPDGGVRVKKMLPQQTASKPVLCSVCGKEITDVEINGVKYTVPQILKSTKDKCYNCYVAEKQSENKENAL